MRVTTLKEYGRLVQARRVALRITGDDSELANSGTSRTPSKRALLKALDDVAEAAGRSKHFKAKY